MWRHVFEGGIRDHAFAPIAPGGKEMTPFVRATFDDWRLDACPHHGPGLASASGSGFHCVWFGVRGEEPGVRYARLDSNGRPGAEVRAIPDPAAEHADVCSVAGKIAIAWRSFDGQRMRYVAWLSSDDGRSFIKQELGATDAAADYPILARRDGEIFALWRASSEIHATRVLA